MALTSLECWEISKQDDVQARVRYSLNKVAVSVFTEAASTPGHAERIAFAKLVLAGHYSIEHTTMALWSNDQLKSSGNINNMTTKGVTDTEILAAVTSLFSVLAGADLATQ